MTNRLSTDLHCVARLTARRRRRVAVLGLLAIALFTSTGLALAGNWRPPEADIVAVGRFYIQVRENRGATQTVAACSVSFDSRTARASTEWSFRPTPYACTNLATTRRVTVTGRNTWRAIDRNAREVELEVPRGGVEFEPESGNGCSIIFERTTLPNTVYLNGTRPLADPSVWMPQGTVSISNSPAQCFSRETTATLLSTIDVLNWTMVPRATEPIEAT